MVASDTIHFPLVDLRAVADSAHLWVALSARLTASGGTTRDDGSAAPDQAPAAAAAPSPSPSAASSSAWQAVFDSGDLLAAIAPLDCIVHLAHPSILTAPLLARLPAGRVLLAIDAACLADDGALRQLTALQGAGYRVLLDGPADGVVAPPTLRAVSHDCAAGLAYKTPLAALFGPHLAHAVDSAAMLAACTAAGFTWFSGSHALERVSDADDDGSSARRLLKLLGLLLADAETRDIEQQLKQDPALCYHLLRLVNSAAFAAATPIHNFAQAIDRLGRRQLLRWLQLLLYARPRADGLANPLLPIAAMRAAQLESLCKQQGATRDEQDLAFQTGVFSLLDVLLGIPMTEIVDALALPLAPANALLERGGVIGALLALAEAPAPTAAALAAADVSTAQWWHSQLHGFHWAIQVSRNL